MQRRYIKGESGAPVTLEASARMLKPTEQEYTHVFLVEFGSAEEREYYKTADPVHADFAARIVTMVDYFRMSVFRESSFEDP